jgi:UDP:flavonoid glycosyltransferase YjiC (YdhE family)
MNRKILFISGSLGLGHVIRDIEIARELRSLQPDMEIDWLASHPASAFLESNGENLLPEAAEYLDENSIAESTSRGFGLNLFRYALKFSDQCSQNVDLFTKITERQKYDLVIGDETYDLASAFQGRPDLKRLPFVMINDFVGFDAMTLNPLERLGIRMLNRGWSSGYPDGPVPYDLGIFVGEPEDVPNRSFGFRLPNRRQFANARYNFVGYILPFRPDEFEDSDGIRSKLGYGNEKLIICAIGGTSIGKGLLELCGKAWPLIKGQIPDVRMILISGPRLSKDSIRVPEGIEMRKYVPRLYQHFAACDLAIVQAGGTTTLELTALKKPFIYFPVEGHCEQEKYVAGRLSRHGAGIKMKFSKTGPRSLAKQVMSNIGKKVNYAPIPVDGARNAAKLISRLL